MLPILRFGVCRSSDLSIHVQRIFPRTNALLQPSLGAMTAIPMTDFHRTQISLHGSNTLEIQLLSEFCPASLRFQIRQGLQTYGRFLPCPGFSPDSLVQRTRMRVREVFGGLTVSPACLACLGRAFATKAMLFSLLYARLFYAHKKTSPALRSRRQKKSRILCIFGLIVRKNYLFI